ncbi:hypothetical protein GCM10009754_80960 [Amycolatopsis minnesotensis]|uniref:Uncharacterized protein n=1 Tax=Amycolatopsis minnesotensis TaxID=337894 RepID=A0ABN2SPZ6_9PSEU
MPTRLATALIVTAAGPCSTSSVRAAPWISSSAAWRTLARLLLVPAAIVTSLISPLTSYIVYVYLIALNKLRLTKETRWNAGGRSFSWSFR